MKFPDLPHLRQLQKELWKWPKSRAALMVGAGFSLNASPLAGVTSKFPTWRELCKAMFDELRPRGLSETLEDEQARNEKFNSTGPLRIASEYEAALGREKLDRLIRERNPDSDFQPGPLHHMLLELPWADVFTTNYDTLLERTDIPGRNYQVVLKADELPTSFAPRIIKLHGSFPSQTPFIITEEDYRTYPRRFAPFVNTVQQSLLENSFVLVGFSGDDPNFLEWTGWIRDELGKYHAPIYLVGPLSLGNAERRLLDNRGVTPIDLAPLFSGVTHDQIHRRAIEWFLNSLSASRPPRPNRWPEFADTPADVSSESPPIIGSNEKFPEVVPLAPNPQVPLTNEIVVKTARRWRFERINYPGWIVLPHEKRKPLWDRTRYWLGPIFHFAKEWPVADRLFLFREINWRIETAMMPLFRGIMMEPIEKVTTDAFSILSKKEVLPNPHIFSQPTTDRDVLISWFELMFGLLREAREIYDEERWKLLKSQIDDVILQCPEFDDQNRYEEVLWAVWNLRRKEAKEKLARWQPSSRSPLASIRKAALLAELDELGESRAILRNTLADIRRALRIHGQNIQLLSAEGWTTYVTFAVEQAVNFLNGPRLREEFWERWQELKAWDCNPWDQTEFFEQELAGDPPNMEAEREIAGFDPGRSSRSVSFTGPIDALLPAFALIRLFEQAGIPLRVPGISFFKDVIGNACNWIAPCVGFWTPAILVRAGNAEGLAKNSASMTRVGVAIMPPEIALRLHRWSLSVFENELNLVGSDIPHRSAQESIFESLPEVISRLAFKIPELELRRSFSLALKFHNLPAVRRHHSLHKISTLWFQRIFEAAEASLLLEWLPELLRIPLFEDVQKPSWRDEDSAWPDPMDQFPAWRATLAADGNPNSIAELDLATDELLKRVPAENETAWRRAMIRLLKLCMNRLLNHEQEQKLGQQAWSRTGSNGLPKLTNLIAFGYVLNFRAPEGIDPAVAVKRYILSLAPKIAIKEIDGKRTSSAQPGWTQQFIHEAIAVSKPIISFRGEALIGIEWTPSEANLLYEKARTWWEKDKASVQTAELRKGDLFFGCNPVFDELHQLDDFLRLAVLPWVDWADSATWDRFSDWLEDLRSADLYLAAVYPYILLHRPAETDRYSNLLLGDLDSNVDAAVAAALEGLRHWAHLASQKGIPSLDPLIIDALVHRAVLRRSERVQYCLSTLGHLIFERSELFDIRQIDLIVASLEPWDYSTKLPIAPGSFEGFPEAMRPHLRSMLGQLSGAIKRWYARMEPTFQLPANIAKWESACTMESLPEVRRSFNHWDNLNLRKNR